MWSVQKKTFLGYLWVSLQQFNNSITFNIQKQYAKSICSLFCICVNVGITFHLVTKPIHMLKCLESWQHVHSPYQPIGPWSSLGPIYTMDHEVGPCKMAFFHGRTSLKNNFINSLGSSLGVNWMWTKGNNHAPKSECAGFFWYMSEKGSFENNSGLTTLLSSSSFSHTKFNKFF